MNTWQDLLFFANLACLVMAHELDAVRRREWRFFFARTSLSDESAYRIFTALHVPVFVFILWNLESARLQAGVDIFLIVHAVIHWFLRGHPLISFDSWFSRLWIFGGAILGAVHLLLLSGVGLP